MKRFGQDQMTNTDHTLVFRKSRFSLIELMVVMGILFILMGFGIAAYQGVKGHKSSEAGAQRMADMIALARQYAISENSRVALLLPDRNSGFYSGTKNVNRLPVISDSSRSPGVMMNVCKVDSSNKFVGWLYDGGWAFMPPNAYFATTGLSEITNIGYPESGNNRKSPALIFQANGTLLSQMTGAIHIDPFSTKPNDYDPGKARQYRMTVNWLTGQSTTQMKVGEEWH